MVGDSVNGEIVEGMAVVTGSEVVIDVVGGVGLTPPLPISNEPNGIPARAAPPGVVGDVAVADEALLLAVVPHGDDMAVLPGSAAPVPTAIPPPSKVAVAPDIPDVGLPMAEQGVLLGIGLRPGDVSAVAPMGIPVGGTCKPGPMPSGEVAPMLGVGLPIPPTWAKAEPQPNRTAAAIAITKRAVIVGSASYAGISLCAVRRTNPTKYVITRPNMTLRRLLRFARCCVDRSGGLGAFRSREPFTMPTIFASMRYRVASQPAPASTSDGTANAADVI